MPVGPPRAMQVRASLPTVTRPVKAIFDGSLVAVLQDGALTCSSRSDHGKWTPAATSRSHAAALPVTEW
jgi:hypothetical protein